VMMLAMVSLLSSATPEFLGGCADPNCPICYPKSRQLDTLLKQGRRDDALALAMEVLREDPKNKRAQQVIEAIRAADQAKIVELHETWEKEDAQEAERRDATERNMRNAVGKLGLAYFQLQQTQGEAGSGRPYDSASTLKPLPVVLNWAPGSSTRPVEAKVSPQVQEMRQSRDALVKEIGALETKLMTVTDPVERYKVVNEITHKNSEKGLVEVKMLDLSVKPPPQEEKKQ
jgi:hypothetical protein